MSNLEKNIKIRQAITEALFTLLEKKSFSEIKVSDIVKEASVARVSYYRNYDKKEDIISDYLVLLHEEMSNALNSDTQEFLSIDSLTQRLTYSCKYFLSKKNYILTLYDNGFGSKMQEIFNIYTEELLGTMKYNSIKKYSLYFISGSSFNILIQWLKNGTKESPNQIASFCSEIFMNGIKNIFEN